MKSALELQETHSESYRHESRAQALKEGKCGLAYVSTGCAVQERVGGPWGGGRAVWGKVHALDGGACALMV